MSIPSGFIQGLVFWDQFYTTNLQRAIVMLTQYYKKWGIKLNTSKTQVIYFTQKENITFCLLIISLYKGIV